MPRDIAALLREDRVRLQHMLDAARSAERYCRGMDRDSLVQDDMRFLAVVKSIEIIGEATSKISQLTRGRITEINWRGIKLMRNRLIHGYDTIDPARVWDAVTLDVPRLIPMLETAIAGWPIEGSTSESG